MHFGSGMLIAVRTPSLEAISKAGEMLLRDGEGPC
jgi:hypothetical protein